MIVDAVLVMVVVAFSSHAGRKGESSTNLF